MTNLPKPDKMFCHGVLCNVTRHEGSTYTKLGKVYYKMVRHHGNPDWVEVVMTNPEIKRLLKDNN